MPRFAFLQLLLLLPWANTKLQHLAGVRCCTGIPHSTSFHPQSLYAVQSSSVVGRNPRIISDKHVQGGKSKAGKKAPLGTSRGGGGGGSNVGGQTVEQRYQKKTQLEHILLRPDTYSECQPDQQWVSDLCVCLLERDLFAGGLL